MKLKPIIAVALMLLISFAGFATGMEFRENSSFNVKSAIHSVGQQRTPINVSIPTANIDASVEFVGETDEGRMDVPRDENNVGWWKYGAGPGESGSMVIAGHVDREKGGPGVFYDIQELKPGDIIEVTDDNNKVHAYEVLQSMIYEDDSFPIERVFAKDDGKYLNLITCNGFYDRQEGNYVDRLVVFSEYKGKVR